MGRRFLIVSVVVAAALSGCSDSAKMDGWTAVPRLAEPLTFDNALADDQVYEDEYWATMQDLGIVLSDETRTDKYGSWHPLTLASDAPVLNIDPSVVPADLDPMWTAKNLRSAWQVAAELLVNEQLDSELVWDDTAENRQLVADRVDASEPSGGGSFSSYFDVDTSSFPIGPLFFDQDHDGWRQAGGETLSKYFPAQPAPYSLDRPRTLIDSLNLDSVTQGDSPDIVDVKASVHYCRPIRIDSVKGHRYECTNWVVDNDIRLKAGEFDSVGIGTSGLTQYAGQEASVSNETRARLPLLEPLIVNDGWLPKEVGSLSLALPSSASPDADESCANSFLEKDPGQVFILGTDSAGAAQCLRVLGWAPSADDRPVTEMVGTNETIWSVQLPGASGTVAISTNLSLLSSPAFDTVDFLLTEGPGPDYRITADVPPGTGKQFARQLLSTLDASKSASPSPSKT